MTRIKVILSMGGDVETEVESYDAKIVAAEVSKSPDLVVSVGDVAFNKNYFVRTSPIVETVTTKVQPNE